MWKNILGPDRPQMPIQCDAEKIQISCWLTKARIQKTSHNIYYLLLLTEIRYIRQLDNSAKEKPLLHFHCNNDRLFIVDRYIYTNNN
jgi:hypothetical protein